jgi:uncharacterized protein YndB with AHSA1/START domain
MTHIQYNITIQRPIDDVFTYITSLDRIAEWQRGVVRSELRSGGELRSGAKVVEVRSFMGREIEAPWEVTVYEPPYVRGFKIAEGPLLSEGAMRFASDGNGTRVSFEAEMRGRGLFRLVELLSVAMIRRQTARDFETVKRILEPQMAPGTKKTSV